LVSDVAINHSFTHHIFHFAAAATGAAAAADDDVMQR